MTERATPWADDEELVVTGQSMLDEARRLRELQDKRIDDIRQRSITIASFIASAVVVVIGLASKPSKPWVIVALAGLAVTLASAALVQNPRGDYTEGPNIFTLEDTQYDQRYPTHQVVRDLAHYHFENYRDNNAKVLKGMQFWFTMQLGALAMAVVAAMLAVAF